MKYLAYKNKLKEPIQPNVYLNALLRVIIDFEERIENDNVLMLGVMDIENLIILVERATPKKEIFITDGYPYYKCPHCDKETGYQDEAIYCRYCGQAIYYRDE